MSSRTLRDTTDDVLALEALLFESGGEVTPELEAWMLENQEHLQAKVDAYGSLLAEWEAQEFAVSEEVLRLNARRKTLSKSQERLKGWLLANLQRMDVAKVQGALFTVSRQNNPRSLEVLAEPDHFPEEYVKVVPEQKQLDKAGLLKALKASGEEVLLDEFGEVLAQLAPVTQSVRIR